ncbi:MAG: ABC transporter ATP-binding protein [Bacteroidota bacterium]
MIEVQQLFYTYPKATTPTLHDLNFRIQEGEIFGFLGPSGAGKSTTQKILYKILTGFQGQVKVKGKALETWDKSYFEQIGVGFELPNHYLKLTARENMQLFSAFYPPKRVQALEPLFEHFGLAEDIDQRVEAYSKGMKVRLNFIRALLHQPDIFFFDEPTSGLDPVNAHKIKNHIVALKKAGKTIFITTHDMATADEICDRVAFIVNGRIETTAAPTALKYEHGEQRVVVELESNVNADFPLAQLGQNPDFLAFLQRGSVRRIYTKEASLEEVFIRITGKALVQ